MSLPVPDRIPPRGAPAKLDLTEVLAELVDYRCKGTPANDGAVTIRDAAGAGWAALDGSLTLPLLLLKESALEHNIELLAAFCRRHGLSLAPHAKTPVAPQIAARQMAAGAWGITVANFHQARLFRRVGAGTILLANELLEHEALRWIAGQLAADTCFRFCCLVDSAAGVEIMEAHLAQTGLPIRLDVLIELGLPGGRCGCRTIGEAEELAERVVGCTHLRLVGVQTYENVDWEQDFATTLQAVDALFDDVRELTSRLDACGRFADTSEIIVTAGGSVFFDRVAARLAGGWNLSRPVRTVLRSGSYVTHDAGIYEERSPLAGRGIGPERLQQALELWAMVLSHPEPGLAVLGFGKRDAAHDRGFPAPFTLRRDASSRPLEPGELTVDALYDQHARVRLADGCDLRVGDLVGLHVSHPCTSFDKFRLVPLVDDGYHVRDVIRCYL